ncbi:hypothetical protein TNIN_143781 [Trichonephila inaurata madagascariensis]|uniref:Uncharacterized protein n=1 Tax=Trichonephila inaurata madagascariensis TaxID=2747483 RepID=A0A8X6XNM7_9ARAC|nr:hypothetical protein TNIN_143781 [Trichonephila inaurata madagascariensis]
MDRREKNKRKPRHKSSQRLEKRKTERHRSPHRHQSGVQDVFTIEASNHPERHHSRSAVQKKVLEHDWDEMDLVLDLIAIFSHL